MADRKTLLRWQVIRLLKYDGYFWLEFTEKWLRNPPLYDERLKNVNLRLSGLKVDISKDEELISLLSTFSEFTTKIQFNTDGEIKNNPFFKSITNKQHLFKVPENLIKFRPFFETNYTVEWIDWKNKGFEFDEKGKCPFCTEKFIPE